MFVSTRRYRELSDFDTASATAYVKTHGRMSTLPDVPDFPGALVFCQKGKTFVYLLYNIYYYYIMDDVFGVNDY